MRAAAATVIGLVVGGVVGFGADELTVQLAP